MWPCFSRVATYTRVLNKIIFICAIFDMLSSCSGDDTLSQASNDGTKTAPPPPVEVAGVSSEAGQGPGTAKEVQAAAPPELSQVVQSSVDKWCPFTFLSRIHDVLCVCGPTCSGTRWGGGGINPPCPPQYDCVGHPRLQEVTVVSASPEGTCCVRPTMPMKYCGDPSPRCSSMCVRAKLF